MGNLLLLVQNMLTRSYITELHSFTPTGLLMLSLCLVSVNIVCLWMWAQIYRKKTRKPWSYLKSGHDLCSICSNIKAKDNTMFSLGKIIFTLIYLSLFRTKVNFSYKVYGEFVGQHQRLSLACTVAGISGTYVWVACEEAPGKNVNGKRWSDLSGVVSLKLL